MAVPLSQQLSVGRYILGKRLGGVRRYPLVLMLEPLFRCNLACPGCGKIVYDDVTRELTLPKFRPAAAEPKSGGKPASDARQNADPSGKSGCCRQSPR